MYGRFGNKRSNINLLNVNAKICEIQTNNSQTMLFYLFGQPFEDGVMYTLSFYDPL